MSLALKILLQFLLYLLEGFNVLYEFLKQIGGFDQFVDLRTDVETFDVVLDELVADLEVFGL